jgi:hypothetical protein
MSLTKHNKIKLFPVRERLVSDVPAGEGEIVNLFYSVDAVDPLL